MKTFLYSLSIYIFTALSIDAQWQQINFPSSQSISTIAVSGKNIFVGTWGDGVFLSSDEGTNWTSVNIGLTNTNITLLDVSDSLIVTATQLPVSTVFRSTNNGMNWELANTGLPQMGVWSFESIGSNFLAGTQDSGIYVNTNNGLNWVRTDTGQTNNLTDCEPIDLDFNGNTLFAGLSNWGGVAMSNDIGVTWNTALGGGYWIQALMANNNSVFAGTDYYGIFRSTDNGFSWLQVNTGLTVLDISAFTCSNTNLFAGTLGGGVFLSTDNGTNWIDVNNGLLSFANVIDLAITDTYIFLSTGYDLWRSPLNEIVPVELISFSANALDDNVELSWMTSTETNNNGFEIERSSEGEFETIGFVNGHGTTTETQIYSYNDRNVVTGLYRYRLKQLDFGGTFEYSNVVDVQVTSPTTFALEQNYPNPFNPSTTVKYSIPNTGFVTLKVYDVLGKEISTLVNEEKSEGIYTVEFEASKLPSGTYFYQIKKGSFVETKKMILLR